MTFLFHQSRYTVRFARSGDDVQLCQRLRHLCFFGTEGVDQDSFDPLCRHLMVVDAADRIVATVRLFEMRGGVTSTDCYAAQSYDLSGLFALRAPMIELGRFCIAPDVFDADVLRVLWGALTQIIDESGVEVVFGCTSFQGTDPLRYGHAFARLRAKHLGPAMLRPAQASGDVIPLCDVPDTGKDPMPPLLRTYLAMGGWVGDHAVIDTAMNTLHIFTCLQVSAVPPARAAALRALAQGPALS